MSMQLYTCTFTLWSMTKSYKDYYKVLRSYSNVHGRNYNEIPPIYASERPEYVSLDSCPTPPRLSLQWESTYKSHWLNDDIHKQRCCTIREAGMGGGLQ
jgi:hypothetical protein